MVIMICYGTISLNKKKEIYLSKAHSKYCDNLKRSVPDNIIDIDDEIYKKDKLISYLNEIYLEKPNLSLVEFSQKANLYYQKIKCNFSISKYTWKIYCIILGKIIIILLKLF